MAERIYPWQQCMQHVAVTDIGMRRGNNQDSHTVVISDSIDHWYNRGHLFVVADGMGAHAAGELASKLAVDNVSHLYYKHHELSPPEALLKAVQEANVVIHNRGEAHAEFHNMGTTLTALLLLPQGALAAHVGDSRLYRVREGKIEQLTFDHSLIWEMRAAGQIAEGEDAPIGIGKNVITRSLGPNSKVKIDLEGPHPVRKGDVYLLCSDGLSGQIKDEEIGAIISRLPPAEAAALLIDLANLRGGPDNITVEICRITGDAIATRTGDVEPLRVGGDLQVEHHAHPALWIVTGVCLLAAAIMLMAGQWLSALLALIGCAIAFTVAVLQKYGLGNEGTALSGGTKLGSGPHTLAELPDDQRLIQRLEQAVEELRQQASRDPELPEMPRFDEYCSASIEAGARGDAKAALSSYGQAIHEFLDGLRQSEKQLSDSAVDLL